MANRQGSQQPLLMETSSVFQPGYCSNGKGPIESIPKVARFTNMADGGRTARRRHVDVVGRSAGRQQSGCVLTWLVISWRRWKDKAVGCTFRTERSMERVARYCGVKIWFFERASSENSRCRHLRAWRWTSDGTLTADHMALPSGPRLEGRRI